MAPKTLLLVVGTRCDPAQDAEFNRWYDQVHIPEVMKAGFTTSARRYQIAGSKEGYPQYLALYEFPDEPTFQASNEYRRKQRRGEAPEFTSGPPYTEVWRALFNEL